MSFFPPIPRPGTDNSFNVTAGEQSPIPQAFIDNPQVDHNTLVRRAGGIDNPLGTIPNDVNIGIGGLGITGSFVGGRLARAGANVTANELADEAGGRLKSHKVGDKNVFELGGMRFPPCETLFYMLAAHHEFGFIPGFPDPGLYSTLIVSLAQKLNVVWDDPSKPPKEVRPIIDAFLALDANGITKDGKQVLCSFSRMRGWLQSPVLAVRMQVVPEWQKWIDVFGPDTFEEMVVRIWGDKVHEWDLPGNVPFTAALIKLFGDIGFGSGGFKDLFDRSGTYIMKLLPNGLEILQSTFAKKNADGTLSPAATQDLVRATCNSAMDAGMVCMFSTELTDVRVVYPEGNRKIEFEYTNNGEKTCQLYDAAILTLGLKTPLMQKLAERRGADRLFPDEVCDAILHLDVIASTKLFKLIPKYIKEVPEGYPRNVLTDTVPGQMYTLDYEDADTMVALEDYAWNTGSHAIERLTAEQLHDIIIGTLEKITKGTPYADLPDRFRRYSTDQLIKIDWQKEEGFYGAFVLAGRNQDKHASALAYDFLKLKKDPNAVPVFPVSDNGHSGGWAEEGQRNGIHVESALIDHYGTLKNPEIAPVNVMTEGLYRY